MAFNLYPAMHATGPNVGGALAAGAQVGESIQRSRLMESQIKRQDRVDSLLERIFGEQPQEGPAGGAPSAETPGMLSEPEGYDQAAIDLLAMIDPAMADRVMSMSERLSEQAKTETMEQVKQASYLLEQVESLPAPARPEAWKNARAQWQKIGGDTGTLPEEYDPDMAASLDVYLRAVGEEFGAAVSPIGKLEQDRRAGYLDEETFAAARTDALRAPENTTALMKDVPYIAQTLGVSPEEAMNLKLTSRTMSRDDFKQQATLRFASGGFNSPEQAAEMAEELTSYVYDEGTKPKEEAASPGLVARIKGYFGGEAAAGTEEDPYKPESEEDYQKIPSGKVFVDPDDNKPYRKP